MNAKKRVFRVFFVWEDEQEEQWLSRMAGDGWHLKGHSFPYYTFEGGPPCEVAYRLDYQVQPKLGKQEYFGLFKDAGWEHVLSLSNWHYFRHPVGDGQIPEIFTDSSSRVDKYRRLMVVLMLFMFLNLYGIWFFGYRLAQGRLWTSLPGLVEGIRFLNFLVVVGLSYAIVRTLIRIGRLRRQSKCA